MAKQEVIISIDAGTTGVTVLMVGLDGAVVARGYREFEQHFPQPGWVEHEPEQIWQATLEATKAAYAATCGVDSEAGETNVRAVAIGITNQRETIAVWNRTIGEAATRAIVWQDRRTSALVEQLKALGLESLIRSKTGLPLDPYFSASKLLWMSSELPEVWARVQSGELVVGTIDSYLVSRLTGGKSHITDASNASRTQLLNIETGHWDDELLNIFKVPREALPTVVSSWGHLAVSDPAEFFGFELPISGIAGDQQAALFGQLAFAEGQSKCTYGTGAFILQNTGSRPVRSKSGLLTTIAWRSATGELTYALEGSVFVAGAAVQWLRDGLGLIQSAGEIEAVAASVPDSGGVVFVPALTGLGAPYWDADARGTVLGLTRGTTKAHLARATLEAMAFQVSDIVDAFNRDCDSKTAVLRVDGGATANRLLLQLQADVLGIPVERLRTIESTALGAALLAALGVGLFDSLDALAAMNAVESRFEPSASNTLPSRARWQAAVAAARAFGASEIGGAR